MREAKRALGPLASSPALCSRASRETAGRRADATEVLDDERPLAGAVTTRQRRVGKAKAKVAPCVVFGVAHSRPPCPSMMERLIDRPMPMPSGLVVKKALNSWVTVS